MLEETKVDHSLLENLTVKIEQLSELVSRQQAEINHLKADRTANRLVDLSEKKTSRRKLLKAMGVAAAGIATVGALNATAPGVEASQADGGAIEMGEVNVPQPVSGAHPVTALRNFADTTQNVPAPTLFHVEQANTSVTSTADGLRFLPATDSGLTDIQNVTLPGGTVKPFASFQIALASAHGLPAGSGATAKTNIGHFTAALGANGTALYAVGSAPTTSGATPAAGTGDVVTVLNAASLLDTAATNPTSAGVKIVSNVPMIFASVSSSTIGAPTSGTFAIGSLYVDSQGSLFYYASQAGSSTGIWIKLVGRGSAGSVQFLATPVRIATTRTGATAPTKVYPKLTGAGDPPVVNTAATATIDVTAAVLTGSPIPATAKGVLGSVGNVDATGAGNLRIWPAGTAPNVAALNIPGGLSVFPNLITFFSSGLSGGRLIIGAGGTASIGFNIDIVGWYE